MTSAIVLVSLIGQSLLEVRFNLVLRHQVISLLSLGQAALHLVDHDKPLDYVLERGVTRHGVHGAASAFLRTQTSGWHTWSGWIGWKLRADPGE